MKLQQRCVCAMPCYAVQSPLSCSNRQRTLLCYPLVSTVLVSSVFDGDEHESYSLSACILVSQCSYCCVALLPLFLTFVLLPLALHLVGHCLHVSKAGGCELPTVMSFLSLFLSMLQAHCSFCRFVSQPILLARWPVLVILLLASLCVCT